MFPLAVLLIRGYRLMVDYWGLSGFPINPCVTKPPLFRNTYTLSLVGHFLVLTTVLN